MILVLIRHGKTAASEKKLYCGKTDVSLSEGGIKELKEKSVMPLPIDISNFRVITSGMKRCEETLSILFGDIPHEICNDFREMDFGDFEMHSYEELKNNPEYIEWISGNNEANTAPNGENGEKMRVRVIEGLCRILKDNCDTLLVTHGGVIAIIMDYLFPNENKTRYELQPHCGEGYIINLKDDSYRLSH